MRMRTKAAGWPTNTERAMSITEIDRIVAAYERACEIGSVPSAKRISVVAQALGISEEMVREALEQQGVEA